MNDLQRFNDIITQCQHEIAQCLKIINEQLELIEDGQNTASNQSHRGNTEEGETGFFDDLEMSTVDASSTE